MPPTMTRSTAPKTPTRSGRAVAGWAAVGLAALAVALGAGPLLDPPPSVDLVVVNETEQAVTVVVGGGSGPELPVGTIDAGEERPVQDVLDQGRAWTISYRVAGDVVAEQAVTREELAEQGFRLTVPAGS